MSNLVGRTIGPYKIIDKIGQGGMAEVYRAYHTMLGAYRAIKVMLPWMAGDVYFPERFRREAMTSGGLRHPNIVQVYDAGEFEGRPYIVMDYIPGGNLADRLARGPLPVEAATAVAAQIADALDYAHRHDIVHRDVKPSNILLDATGSPVLVDFGIAQAVSTGPRLTQVGQSIGTPEYMSPEQCQGHSVDGRSDVYSLAIVLYQMVTGRVPFRGHSNTDVAYQVVNQRPTPPRQLNPQTPPYLESIILRALAKRPEDRFRTAAELAQALRDRRVVTPPINHGPKEPIGVASARRPRKRGLAIALAGVLLAVFALVGLAAFLSLHDDGSTTPTPEFMTLEPEMVAHVTETPLALPSATSVLRAVTTFVVTATEQPTREATNTPFVVVITVMPSPTPVPSSTPTRRPRPPTSTPTKPKPSPTPTKPPPATSVKALTAVVAKAPPPGVVLDFENFGAWRRGSQHPYGELTQTRERVHEGSYAAKLSYDIPDAKEHFVDFQRVTSAPIPGQPAELTLWVYGDGSGNYLNAWVQDNQGEVRQFTFGNISHAGVWQQMTARLDTTLDWPQDHISGPDNGRLDYPIKLYGLVLDAVPRAGTTDYAGTIYLDGLKAGVGGTREPITAATAPTAPTPPTPRTTSAMTGWIAYVEDRTLKAVDVASRSSTTLGFEGTQPDVRGDGRVVFKALGGGTGREGLWSVLMDGSGIRMVSAHPEDSYPHWSSTGDSVTFWSTQHADRKDRIYIQTNAGVVEDPKILQVNNRDVFGRYPVWLGSWRIAFTGCNYWASGSNCGIWTVNSNGSGQPTQLTERMQDISADGFGSTLLYASEAGGNWDIYAINENGGPSRNLTNAPGQDFGASFSPDGAFIAFMSNRDGSWGIWTMNADGSNPQKLIAVPGGFGSNWSEETIAWGR